MLTREMIRALGVGVDRLYDGDLQDRTTADSVVMAMTREGYLYGSGSFLSRDAILVNGSLHPQGSWVLSEAEIEAVIRGLGALPEELSRLIDECRYLDLPGIVLESMARAIRDLRHKKGLRFEPEDLA